MQQSIPVKVSLTYEYMFICTYFFICLYVHMFICSYVHMLALYFTMLKCYYFSMLPCFVLLLYLVKGGDIMPNDTEILHESISQLMQDGFSGEFRGGLSLDKHDFNLDEPLLSAHCQGCQNAESCPWVSVSDCVTAETDAWFGHLFIDPHLD